MKYFLIPFFLFLFSAGYSQDAQFDVPVKNMAGEIVNFQEVVSDGRNKVVVFWATYCAGCKLEMKAINFFDQKWNDEYNADVIVISIDGSRNQDKAQQILQEKGFTGYEAYLDDGMKLYKNVKARMIPLTLLIDGEGNVVKRWEVYDDGLESSIDRYLAKLANSQ